MKKKIIEEENKETAALGKRYQAEEGDEIINGVCEEGKSVKEEEIRRGES